DIPARPRKAGCEPFPDRIEHRRCHDRSRRADLAHDASHASRAYEDDVDSQRHQFIGKSRKLPCVAARGSVLDGDVDALDISALAQPLAKGFEQRLDFGRLKGWQEEKPYSRDLGRALCTCGERRDDAAERSKTNESPSVHYRVPLSAKISDAVLL